MLRQPWRRLRAILALACLLAQVATVSPTAAADGWESRPGTMAVLYADDREVQTYVAPPPQATYLRAQAATITVEYQNFPSEAKAAFAYAVQVWQSLLVAPIPIRVSASWEALPTGMLGGAGPNDFYRNQTTMPDWHPVALAKQIANRDLAPDEPDIVAEFNSTGVNWYFGTGQTPPGQLNFAMVVLHELGHGLGFSPSLRVRSGAGTWGANGVPFIYDRFVADDGGSLLDTNRYENPSTALAAAIQSNRLFFGGTGTRAANGGNPARLYAPNPYEQGSSVGHFDEATYPPGDPNSLMTPFGSKGETNYNPGPLALGVLKDIGWQVTNAPIPSPQPSPAPSPAPSPGGPSRCFPETNQCLSGRFLAYWEAHGGLAINGYPLSDERREKLEDGKEYLVQWFERVRMEYHPENSAPNNVLLGQFGRLIHPADPPVAGIPGLAYFPQTGHNVPPDFMGYWDANGGLPQFGFPLGEVLRERLEDGKEYEVQYFERARFERHPESSDPRYRVLLGQFGRRILTGQGAPGPSPSPAANVLLQDDFTNPNSGWPTYRHPEGHYEAGYLPGEYRIALAAANYRAIITNRNIAPQANVQLEADMTRFGPVQEPLFGFACRAADPDNFYGALIATDGYALLFKFSNGRYVEFGRVQAHPAIKRGNATNRVRFDCVGNQLTLYANGTPVLSAQDGEFGGGQQGFLVYAFDKGGLDLHIRNFVAYRR